MVKEEFMTKGRNVGFAQGIIPKNKDSAAFTQEINKPNLTDQYKK